jgi:hypothetical protein
MPRDDHAPELGPVGRRPSGAIEPLTLLTALAGATQHIFAEVGRPAACRAALRIPAG